MYMSMGNGVCVGTDKDKRRKLPKMERRGGRRGKRGTCEEKETNDTLPYSGKHFIDDQREGCCKVKRGRRKARVKDGDALWWWREEGWAGQRQEGKSK